MHTNDDVNFNYRNNQQHKNIKKNKKIDVFNWIYQVQLQDSVVIVESMLIYDLKACKADSCKFK